MPIAWVLLTNLIRKCGVFSSCNVSDVTVIYTKLNKNSKL